MLEFESIAKDAGWTAPRLIEIKSDTNFRAELANAAYQALLGSALARRSEIACDRSPGYCEASRLARLSTGSLEFSFDPDAVSG